MKSLAATTNSGIISKEKETIKVRFKSFQCIYDEFSF